ncbi:MAG: hypothetical protein ACMUHY_04915 [Thermoplasmatota archaeon]
MDRRGVSFIFPITSQIIASAVVLSIHSAFSLRYIHGKRDSPF